MDFYKKIIKSRSMRVKILEAMNFIPDKTMIQIQYKVKTGRRLNLKDPKRYTEKLQYYKLNYRDPLMTKCVDKYEVRKYVMECGCQEILNTLIGLYNKPEEIDFDALPNKFVIKDTLGGGGNSIIICKDKNRIDTKKIRTQINKWIKSKQRKSPGREWVYDKGRHRIIVENYIESDDSKGGLIDYKFFCFNGKVCYVYGIADRNLGKGTALGIFDKNFNLLPYERQDEKPLSRKLEKPENYDKMLMYAENLSKQFPHARIDLYNKSGKIIFGEITFFDGSGYMKFNPDEFDFILGEKFDITKLRGGTK